MVGNPYPAFLNANTSAEPNDNFLSRNLGSLDPNYANIYLWNPSTTSYEPVGNGLGAKYIAPGQAFFIKSNGRVKFYKSTQTYQSGDLFLKGNQSQKIVLKIDNKTSISETTIAFKNGMTKGLDITYDAAVFSGESKKLSIYTHLLNENKNVPFAIQFLPELENKDVIIPLGIKQNKDSEITLSLQNPNISSDVKIYLEDKILNTFTELSIHKNYKFSHKQSANGLGRFFLHIQKNALNLDSTNTSTIKIYKKNNHALQVNGINEGWINIFDINGKNIIKNIFIKNLNQTIQLPKISKGIYIINIKKNNGSNFIKKITF